MSETRDHGWPVLEHLQRLVSDEIVWAPAIDGAFVVSTPGRRLRPITAGAPAR